MITLAMLARAAEPGPWPRAIGTIAATSITVVIRIGRSRVWLASRIASSRGMPRGAELVGGVDLQDAVLLDDADQHEQAEHRVEVHRRAGSRTQRQQAERDRHAAGPSGSRSGAIQLSNCAARIRYMKTIERPNAIDEVVAGLGQRLGLAGELR